MAALDGKEPVTPVPFDAHDKVVRQSNEADHREFPKAVDHREMPDGHLEPIVAQNRAHEAELKAKPKAKKEE